MQVAKYADEKNLSSINIEFSSIIESIRKKDQSFKDTIPRLCYLLEKKFELDDPLLMEDGFEIETIQQISTEISRYFTRKGLKIAPWVHDYCPSKYKDQSKIHNNSSDVRAAQPREIDTLLGLTNLEREVLNQIDNVSNLDLETIYHFCCSKVKNKCESVARDRKLLLAGHENREQYRTKKPAPKVTEYWRSIEWFRNGPMLAYQEYVRQFPPPDKEKEKNWINGIYAWGNIYYSIVNLKESLTFVQWISRIKYLIHHSKHGAAVHDLVETMICDNCWDDKLQREREGCNAEMMYDPMSPTTWKCGTCGGFSGKPRGLTREQCGDNKSPTLTKAEELIHYLLNNFEAHDYYGSFPQKIIYTRKIWLGGDLSRKS